MKIGIAFANIAGFGTGEGAAELASAAEAAGVESLWTVEHVIFPNGYQSAYPYDDSGRMPMTPRHASDRPTDLAHLGGRPDLDHPTGHGDPHPPRAQPGGPGQGGGHP